MGRLDGKVALVTGGARGNGLGIALELARDGADVALADLSADALAPAAAEVEALGRRCAAVVADVTDEDAVERMLGEAAGALGGLDVLVNNAGIFPFKPIDEFTVEDFHKVIDINLLGPWLVCKHGYPLLKARGGGAIVNIASCSGHYGGAAPGGSLYDPSKAGLRQLTSTLAAEFAPHKIRVNAISPGEIVTPGSGGMEALEAGKFDDVIKLTPLQRMGFPEDVGRAAAFLASDDSSYITGTAIVLDGGTMAVWGWAP